MSWNQTGWEATEKLCDQENGHSLNFGNWAWQFEPNFQWNQYLQLKKHNRELPLVLVVQAEVIRIRHKNQIPATKSLGAVSPVLN